MIDHQTVKIAAALAAIASLIIIAIGALTAISSKNDA